MPSSSCGSARCSGNSTCEREQALLLHFAKRANTQSFFSSDMWRALGGRYSNASPHSSRTRPTEISNICITLATAMLSAQPLQLVELKRPPNGALAAVLNTEAMKAIGELQKPVKVLAIVGAYRKGKSLILNQVLGVPSNSGFALGHKVSGETRGIWVWGKDQGDHVLLCLDTEGLGDVQNRNPEFDARLFAITLCLSSMLIVNVSTVLSEKEIADLRCVGVNVEYKTDIFSQLRCIRCEAR